MIEEQINDQEAQQDGALVIAPFMDSVLARFAPVDTASEATHYFSTDEVYRAIRELSPYLNGFNLSDVHQALLNLGYILGSPKGTIGLQFKWLMKER